MITKRYHLQPVQELYEQVGEHVLGQSTFGKGSFGKYTRCLLVNGLEYGYGTNTLHEFYMKPLLLFF